MPELILKVDRYEDAEIYAFDLFRRDGHVQFYNTWESDRTFQSKCPLGLPGKKFLIGNEEFVVRSYTIRVIDGSNVWVINYSKTNGKLVMSGIMEDIHARVRELETAIRTHRDQRADDRCWLDDLTLYSVLDDGVEPNNQVGDQCAMLKNCERFIKQRCEAGGPWKSYAELESENVELRSQLSPPIHLDRPMLPVVNVVFNNCDTENPYVELFETFEQVIGQGIFPEEEHFTFIPDDSGTPPDLR